MRRSFTALGVMLALAAIIAAQASSAPTRGAQAQENKLGVLVVKFAKGTTAAQMQSAVTSAGGEVVTDLSKLGAITAVSSSSSFTPDLEKNKALPTGLPHKPIPLSPVRAPPGGPPRR